MYKFEIQELAESDSLRLIVYQSDTGATWQFYDIIEGPSRFIINRIASYYSDDLRLRKIK